MSKIKKKIFNYKNKKVKGIYYKIRSDDYLNVLLHISSDYYLIINYELIKVSKPNFKDYEEYTPFKEHLYNYDILGIKIDYLEMDIRIKLDKGIFVTIFRLDNGCQELDIFFSEDIDDDFLDAYNNDSEFMEVKI